MVWGIGFSLLTALEGGVHGFGIVWLVCGCPLLALLILARREALLWCAFCFFITFVFAALGIADINLPLAYPAKWEPYVRAASMMGLVVFMSLLGILFEYARHEAVLSMEQAFNEQKRSERAKVAAEGANRAKDQFLGILSHELRTPLTPVLATVSEMEIQKHLPPELKADLTLVRRNVELEAKLIDDLLDITRISSGKLVLHLETVDAHSCFQSAVEICRAELESKQLEFSTELHAPEHYVQADPVRLRQVFWNLLRNAIKFTPPLGQIRASSSNAGEKLKIQITDTGVGIDPEIIPRIFNAFEQGEQTRTRRFGGLGLGLSIAKSVMEMHQGKITALSEGKGKGATFIVEINAFAAVEAEEPISPLTSAPMNAKLPRILLVEDDHDTLQVLSKLLQRDGYEVIPAESIQKGLELSRGEPIDLLISDLGLPDGSGLDLMRQLKKRHGIPGIALSGYGTDEDLRQSRAAGFAQHIIKPVNIGALRAAIRQITGG
jgi:signal transduction histidine kinase